MNRHPVFLRLGAACLCLAFLAACGTSQKMTDLDRIEPGETPAEDTVEAGLWMKMDDVEKDLKGSRLRVRDPELNGYVRQVVCRISPEYCEQIRVYILKRPYFNASMAPNGVMVVWTGLLLRAENEAQLAFVLGHELAHFQERHTLKRWQDLRSKTDGLMFFKVATAVVGLGIVGQLSEIAVLGSVMSFSRDQERESDQSGLEMIAAAGYDPREGSKIWQYLIAEREAEEDEEPSVFFSSHPSSKERAENLVTQADAILAERPEDGLVLGKGTYLARTRAWHREWLKDELRLRRYDGALELFNRLIANEQQDREGISPSLVQFFRGEVFRLRHEDGDARAALTAYDAALSGSDVPVEVHRGRGLVLWELGQEAAARRAFERYLQEAPEAEDRLLIENYLSQLS
jgi:predicted Zn-dependent protease